HHANTLDRKGSKRITERDRRCTRSKKLYHSLESASSIPLSGIQSRSAFEDDHLTRINTYRQSERLPCKTPSPKRRSARSKRPTPKASRLRTWWPCSHREMSASPRPPCASTCSSGSCPARVGSGAKANTPVHAGSTRSVRSAASTRS